MNTTIGHEQPNENSPTKPVELNNWSPKRIVEWLERETITKGEIKVGIQALKEQVIINAAKARNTHEVDDQHVFEESRYLMHLERERIQRDKHTPGVISLMHEHTLRNDALKKILMATDDSILFAEIIFKALGVEHDISEQYLREKLAVYEEAVKTAGTNGKDLEKHKDQLKDFVREVSLQYAEYVKEREGNVPERVSTQYKHIMELREEYDLDKEDYDAIHTDRAALTAYRTLEKQYNDEHEWQKFPVEYLENTAAELKVIRKWMSDQEKELGTSCTIGTTNYQFFVNMGGGLTWLIKLASEERNPGMGKNTRRACLGIVGDAQKWATRLSATSNLDDLPQSERDQVDALTKILNIVGQIGAILGDPKIDEELKSIRNIIPKLKDVREADDGQLDGSQESIQEPTVGLDNVMDQAEEINREPQDPVSELKLIELVKNILDMTKYKNSKSAAQIKTIGDTLQECLDKAIKSSVTFKGKGSPKELRAEQDKKIGTLKELKHRLRKQIEVVTLLEIEDRLNKQIEATARLKAQETSSDNQCVQERTIEESPSIERTLNIGCLDEGLSGHELTTKNDIRSAQGIEKLKKIMEELDNKQMNNGTTPVSKLQYKDELGKVNEVADITKLLQPQPELGQKATMQALRNSMDGYVNSKRNDNDEDKVNDEYRKAIINTLGSANKTWDKEIQVGPIKHCMHMLNQAALFKQVDKQSNILANYLHTNIKDLTPPKDEAKKKELMSKLQDFINSHYTGYNEKADADAIKRFIQYFIQADTRPKAKSIQNEPSNKTDNMNMEQYIEKQTKGNQELASVFLAISVLARQCDEEKLGFGYTAQIEQIHRDWLGYDTTPKAVNYGYKKDKYQVGNVFKAADAQTTDMSRKQQ